MMLFRREGSWDTDRGTHCWSELPSSKEYTLTRIDIRRCNRKWDREILEGFPPEETIEVGFNLLALEKSFFHIEIHEFQPRKRIEYLFHLMRSMAECEESPHDRTHARSGYGDWLHAVLF